MVPNTPVTLNGRRVYIAQHYKGGNYGPPPHHCVEGLS